MISFCLSVIIIMHSIPLLDSDVWRRQMYLIVSAQKLSESMHCAHKYILVGKWPNQKAEIESFPIRIGRKAMTLGGDSSRAAIARSSAIREWRDWPQLNGSEWPCTETDLNCGQECMHLSQRQKSH